jgi:hypothetical protein
MTVPPKGYTTSVNVSFTKEGGIYKKSVLCKLTHTEILLLLVRMSASTAERHHDSPGAMSSFAAILPDSSLLAISAPPP